MVRVEWARNTYNQSSRPWECGNPEGISKGCGKDGKPASWLSILPTPCHFHGLLSLCKCWINAPPPSLVPPPQGTENHGERDFTIRKQVVNREPASEGQPYRPHKQRNGEVEANCASLRHFLVQNYSLCRGGFGGRPRHARVISEFFTN